MNALKIKVYVHTHMVGSQVERVVEIPEREMEGMRKQERQAYLEEVARQELFSMIEWGWDEIKEEVTK